MQRSIEAPDKEWLDSTEAAAWLNIGEPSFNLLVREGVIPPGEKMSRKAVRWHWEVVWSVSVLLKSGILRHKNMKKYPPNTKEPAEREETE